MHVQKDNSVLNTDTKDNTRITNSIRNMATSATTQIVIGVLSFFNRTIFIKYLSSDFLGLNELFGTVLYVLSLSELGIGSAITFALYKPIAEGNLEQIRTYMHFFKKVYTAIGCVIIGLGLCFSPFIKSFVKSENAIDHLELYFIIYLFSVGFTYFYSYKQILIEADQKKYITQLVFCIATIIQLTIQTILIIFFKSYILYLITFFICNIGKNIYLAVRANKEFPILKLKKPILPIGKQQLKDLSVNIKAMFVRKLGEVSIGAIDNLLISSFVGLTTLGLYANYQVILEALRSTLRVFYTSITASIGNLCASETTEKAYSSFRSLNFINSLLSSFITVLLVILFQPCMVMWLGESFLLNTSTVILIALNFYLAGTRQMVLNYHAAYGLFWADKFNPLAQAIINLVVSILLVKPFGLNGILAGTTISSIATWIWIEPYVVFKYGFQLPVKKYYQSYAFFGIITTILSGTMYFLTSWIHWGRFGTFFGKLTICIMILPFLYWLIFKKNEDFKSMLTFTKKIIRLKLLKSK
jgi:O-antigen/teichoic acid export membrane protein